MSQFDVYKNLSKHTRHAYPYIVDIQIPLISELATRIVIPLGKSSHFIVSFLSRRIIVKLGKWMLSASG